MSDDATVHAELRYRLRVGELAEALLLVSRAAHPIRARVLTGVGVFLALVLVLLFASTLLLDPDGSRGAGRQILGLAPAALLYALVLSPHARAFLLACVVAVSQRGDAGDHLLESFSRSAIRGRAKSWSGETSPGVFPIRIETARLFVFANAEGVLGPVIPKRIFPDATMCDRFREYTITAPTGVEVTAALQALGDPTNDGAIVYTPDVDEQLRGLWLLLRHTASLPFRLFMLAVPTFLVGFVISQARRDGPLVAALTAVVCLALGLYVRHSMRKRMAAAIRPVTLRIDDQGISATAPNGALEVGWNQSLGYLEKDPRLLIVMIRPAFGLLLPTRVLPAEVIAETKRRLAPYGR